MRTRCHRLRQRAKGLSLVVVDYLQLMRPSVGTKPENRVLEISQITQGLKALAKELTVPVLALSQLSRAVKGREDKRPQLADLRESGTIEQNADVVMFVYRDECYIGQREPKVIGFDNEAKSRRPMPSGSPTWRRCTTSPSSSSPNSATVRRGGSSCSSKPSSPASLIRTRCMRGDDRDDCRVFGPPYQTLDINAPLYRHSRR